MISINIYLRSGNMSVVALGAELDSLTMSNIEDLYGSDRVRLLNARSGNSLY